MRSYFRHLLAQEGFSITMRRLDKAGRRTRRFPEMDIFDWG